VNTASKRRREFFKYVPIGTIFLLMDFMEVSLEAHLGMSSTREQRTGVFLPK
jgi:hypothetical protein